MKMMDSEIEQQDAEEEESVSDPVSVLEAKRTQQQAILLMLFMIVGLNSAWMLAQSQTSDIEVNRPGAGQRTIHTFEVPDMMLMSKDVPVTMDCEFTFDESKEANNSNVSWSISDARGLKIHEWSGEVGDDCGAEFSLRPGIHRVSTSIPYAIKAEQTLHMRVWKGLSMEGHIIATMMAFLFPLPAILTAYRRVSKATRSVPLARMRRLEDWQEIHREMEALDRTAAEIHDLEPFTGETISMERSFTPEPVLQDKVVEAKDVPDIPEIDQTDLIEDMERDTLAGLEDPLAADKRIRKVGDIYDLMKDD
jgi:hypothetical protein